MTSIPSDYFSGYRQAVLERAGLPDVTLEPFLPAHGMLLRMRDSSRDVEHGFTDDQLAFGFRLQAQGGIALSARIQGLLIAAYGVYPEENGAAEMWMIVDDHTRDHHARTLLRMGKAVVYVSHQYLLLTLLRMTVRISNVRAMRYAEALGFRARGQADGAVIYEKRASVWAG